MLFRSGKSLKLLPKPFEELIHRHEQWALTTGSEGAPLDLTGYDLRQSPSLAGAVLSTLKADGAVFYGLNLEGVGLQAAQLEGADLRCCRLNRADLRGVNLAGARLNYADLRDSDFGPLIIDEHHVMLSRLDGIVARHADFRGAKLKRASLFRADLSSADFTGANVSGAFWAEANLNGVRGLPD